MLFCMYSLSKSKKPIRFAFGTANSFGNKRHVYISADIEDPNNIRKRNWEQDQKSIKITW